MNSADKPIFINILMQLSVRYDKVINTSMIDEYFLQLKKLDLERIKEVINFHVSDQKYGQYWPKISDLKKYSQELREDKLAKKI